METKDYYRILGVPPNADLETIKRAYRELARRHHPDMNPDNPYAQARFIEIQEAYTVLTDPGRRRAYDRYRSTGEPDPAASVRPGPKTQARSRREERRGQATDPFAAFSDFFHHLFGSLEQARPVRQLLQGGHRTLTVEISLEEAFRGTSRWIQQGRRRFEVAIPPGVRTGSQVQLDQGRLTLTVQVMPHPRFVRKGDDLHTRIQVDLYTVLLGGEVSVPTLTGSVVLRIPPDTQNGQVFRLSGQGMPHLHEPKRRGDLFVETWVQLPVPLSPEERRSFEILRGLRRG